MSTYYRPMRIVILLAFLLSLIAGCGAPAAAPGEAAAPAADAGAMTEVGTPRNETLIVQTFDGKTNAPDNMNPLMGGYALWRGFRELAWGYLWEMDTATGQSYPELAAELPVVLNDEYTQFEIRLRPGVYWSDGVEFTADDVIFTLDTYFNNKDKLTYWGVPTITNYVKSYEKVDDYTLRVETVKPAYDFATTLGVYTWGSAFNIVPKHVFEKETDLAAFKNEYPVTLGAYTLNSYDPNGQWHLWERREDWDRSATAPLGEPAAKYVFYKNFGDEQTRTLAFIKNEYDVDTFMSPDSIAAAQAQNPNVHTFAATLPYHDMNDACSYGIILNNQKAPLDMPEVRWALALSLDLPNVGTNSMSGQFKASAFPMPDTQITRPAFFEPLQAWLNELTLADGYKPYNPNFGEEMVTKLTEMGMDAAQLPTGDAVTENFGLGWWKADPAQAEKLMNSVGMMKDAEGFYTLPDGSPWTLELVIPSDWNKVMQRVGFSIADSWTKAGFRVNARQVDNAEFTTVQNTNSLLQTMVNWSTSCVFNTNFVNNWRSFKAENLKPVDSSEQIIGNAVRIDNQLIFDKIAEAGAMDMSQPEFLEAGQEIIKEMITNMYYINMMNIPTTIPTNETYWTNFPKQENAYAVPYTWWSSFKKILTNIEPAAQ